MEVYAETWMAILINIAFVGMHLEDFTGFIIFLLQIPVVAMLSMFRGLSRT